MKDKQHHDSIPQRPFRRLSSVGATSCSLFVVSEDKVREEDEVPKRDHPPRKPHCTSSPVGDTNTSTTFVDVDDYDDSSDYSVVSGGVIRFAKPTLATFEKVKAREQPNTKAPTIPIEFSSEVLNERKQIIEDFWRFLNERNLEGAKSLVTEDFQLVSVGARRRIESVMTCEEAMAGAKAVFEALPDMHFMYRAIEESRQVPGTLVVQDCVMTGHHTGKAFAMGRLPPIAATGKLVVLDESETHFHFDPITNKIWKQEEIAMGETSGMAGIYSLLSRP